MFVYVYHKVNFHALCHVFLYMEIPCHKFRCKIHGNFLATKLMARYMEISMYHFHRHFSLTAKMSLEISTDILLPQPKCRWKFPKTFLSHSWKFPLIFFSHSQNEAGNLRRHSKLLLENSTHFSFY